MTNEDKASMNTMGRLFGQLGQQMGAAAEADHFRKCNTCGDPFDMRDLSQVCEHEHAGVVEDVVGLARLADELLAEALAGRGR